MINVGARSVQAALFCVLAALVIVPLLLLLSASFMTAPPFGGIHADFTAGNYSELTSPGFLAAIRNTFLIAIPGTVIAVTLGSALAWLTVRTDIAWKPIAQIAGISPLFISLLVAAAAWMALGSDRSGYLNMIFQSLHIPLHINIQSIAGIAFVFGLYYAPYPFIFVSNALALIHPDMEEAAAVHGASPFRSIANVTFPLVKPALLGSTLLVFALMIEDFPVPELLGAPAGIETLPVRIYQLMTRVPSAPNRAAAVSIALLIVMVVFVYLQQRLLKGRDYRTVTGKGMQHRLVRLGPMRWPALACILGYFIVAVGLPLFALLEGALRTSPYIASAASLFDIHALSWNSIVMAVQDPDVQQGALNSVAAGIATAILGTALAFVAAYVVYRTRFRTRKVFEYLAMTPIAVPSLFSGSVFSGRGLVRPFRCTVHSLS